MLVILGLTALFGLSAIVVILTWVGGREFDAPVRDYSEPRI